MQNWQCRVAPSLGGGFAGTPNEVWGTVDYTDDTKPCVFFGMYGMQDLQIFNAHKGDKAILWAGSDIRHFLNGYWLDGKGDFRAGTKFPVLGLYSNYVENMIESLALNSVGVRCYTVPSFLGDIEKYQPQQIDPKPRYYMSVSGDDFNLYGWNEVEKWAETLNAEIHLYGNRKEWWSHDKRIIVHGRVPQEQMDEETKTMTGALRLTRFDGFSEILAKSILWGQKPLSPYIHYPFLHNREMFIREVNNYPWNAKKH